MARDHGADRQSRAVEWYMHKVEAERLAKQFGREMSRRPNPSRSVVVFAGIGFDECDELLDRLRRHRWVDREHHSCGDCKRYRVEVLQWIVGDLVVQRRIDDVVGSNNQDSVPVGCGLCCPPYADIAASTGDVLDIELLTESLLASLPRSTRSSSFRVSQLALPEGRRAFRAGSFGQPATQSAGLLARGRERDLPGFQAIHPVPLPRSPTTAEPTTPRLFSVSPVLPPRFPRRRLQRLMNFVAQSRGFSTCCLRFKNDVATIPARLAFAGHISAWIASSSRRPICTIGDNLTAWRRRGGPRVSAAVSQSSVQGQGSARP